MKMLTYAVLACALSLFVIAIAASVWVFTQYL